MSFFQVRSVGAEIAALRMLSNNVVDSVDRRPVTESDHQVRAARPLQSDEHLTRLSLRVRVLDRVIAMHMYSIGRDARRRAPPQATCHNIFRLRLYPPANCNTPGYGD